MTQLSLQVIDPGNRAASEESLGLLTAVFGTGLFTPDYWRWKYLDNPNGASFLVGARSSEGALLGFRAMWRWRFVQADREVDGAQPCDTAVHPAHRRLGIFRLMTRKAISVAREDGVEVLFNNPNPEAFLGYSRMGWHDLGGLRWYTRIIRKARIGRALACTGGKLAGQEWIVPSLEWRPGQEQAAPDRLQGWIGSAQPGVCLTKVSWRLLCWRYGQTPHRRYGMVEGTDRSGNQVMVFYGCAMRGVLREIQVMEVVPRNPPARTLATLVDRIVSAEDPDWLVFAGSRYCPTLPILIRAGFLPLPRRASLVGRWIGPAGACAIGEPPISVSLGTIDSF